MYGMLMHVLSSTFSCLLSAPFVALGGLSPNEKEIAKVGVMASDSEDIKVQN